MVYSFILSEVEPRPNSERTRTARGRRAPQCSKCGKPKRGHKKGHKLHKIHTLHVFANINILPKWLKHLCSLLKIVVITGILITDLSFSFNFDSSFSLGFSIQDSADNKYMFTSAFLTDWSLVLMRSVGRYILQSFLLLIMIFITCGGS